MITSSTNPKIKYVRRLQSDRRFREREQVFVVEGTRWLAELIHFNLQPKLVFYTGNWFSNLDNRRLLSRLDFPAHEISEQLMAVISDTQSPAGVLAVAAIQSQPLPKQPNSLLILDQVANPGNMGAMLRTAAAAGVDGVLLAPGSVDAYNPKVLRGAMGAHLRRPIVPADWPEIGRLAAGLAVWLAAADGASDYTAVDWREPSALIIGSEAVGASEEAARLADGRIAIPMHTGTESLNAAVATGIILFEAVRQRRANTIPG